MTKAIHPFHIAILLFCLPLNLVFGQCVPDSTCKDSGGDPGQICPDTIPYGFVGEPYETVVTILPPDTFVYNTVDFPVVKIHVDTIQNLPDGILYELNAGDMYSDSLYCVLLQGTPMDTGTFPLRISVTATLDLGITYFTYNQIDSTSIVFTVQQSTGIKHGIIYDKFEVLECHPNPFRETGRIGVNSRFDGEAELKVYNMLGKMVYQEHKYLSSGETYFGFSGRNISPGLYIYSVSHRGDTYVNRMMKLR